MRCYYCTRTKVFPFLPLEDDDTAFGGFALSEEFPPFVHESPYGPVIFDADIEPGVGGEAEIANCEDEYEDEDAESILVLFYHRPIGDANVLEGNVTVYAFDGDFLLAQMHKGSAISLGEYWVLECPEGPREAEPVVSAVW